MNYDEAIKKIELIVKELEQAEALSMDVYQAKAQEAKDLLDFCQGQIAAMEKEILTQS
ncbi:MAG: exodeoxyribonuclease VII small subunit [Paludibacteraceae bacterium]|nr:exodeoxyribonuclease VII small subunit [Paludibacteraceae bacterium]